MAKLTVILDKRTANRLGRYPVKLRITHNNSNTTASANIFISENAFTGKPENICVRTYANAKQVNAYVKELYYQYLNAIHELESTGRLRAMTASDIKRFVEGKKEFHTEYTFTSVFEEYMKTRRTEKTRQTFAYTWQKIVQYSGKERIFFEEIDYKFLTGMDNWMEQHGIGVSSRGIVFRNIRSILNYAINNDWMSQSLYPFRKFKIRTANKEKVYLPEEAMMQLVGLDLSDAEGLLAARDFFLLSFYLCGINPIDLYNLPKTTNKVSFVRTKIRYHDPQPIHLFIQPEAQAIIERHAGREHLIDFAEHYHSFESCYHFLKHRLKKIGELIGQPDITFYWARYSWATYASKIDIPDSTISKALGHTETTLAERRYISFDWNKVDRANRQVIDYLKTYSNEQ